MRADEQRDKRAGIGHEFLRLAAQCADDAVDQAVAGEEGEHDAVDDDPGEEVGHVDQRLRELLELLAVQVEDGDRQQNRRNKRAEQAPDADGQRVADQLEHFRVGQNVFVIVPADPLGIGDRAADLHVLKGNLEAPDDRDVKEHEIIRNRDEQNKVKSAITPQKSF